MLAPAQVLGAQLPLWPDTSSPGDGEQSSLERLNAGGTTGDRLKTKWKQLATTLKSIIPTEKERFHSFEVLC